MDRCVVCASHQILILEELSAVCQSGLCHTHGHAPYRIARIINLLRHVAIKTVLLARITLQLAQKLNHTPDETLQQRKITVSWTKLLRD